MSFDFVPYAFVCPHCGVYSTFDVRAEHSNQFWGGFAKILGCSHCRQLVYVVTDPATINGKQANPMGIIDYYPKRKPKIDDAVPAGVASDYSEAMICFDANAFKAAAAMCRRALQTSVIERGAKNGRLVDQINQLFESKILPEGIKDWAHEIRLIGNVGAHPDEDGLATVTREEVDDLLKFMEAYLNYVYVMPLRVAKRRNARKSSNC